VHRIRGSGRQRELDEIIEGIRKTDEVERDA